MVQEMSVFWWHKVWKLWWFFFFSILYIFFLFFSCQILLLIYSVWSHTVIQGQLFHYFSIFYLDGFLQTVTWSFFIKFPEQNHSAVCNFRWCNKACETSASSGVVETLARSNLEEAFCLRQPVLPPHSCFRQRMQCSQACWDCHSRDHSLTRFSQNDPACFDKFKAWFCVSFGSSNYQLLPPSPSIPTSMFPSLFLCWHFAVSRIAKKAGLGCTGDWGSWFQDWAPVLGGSDRANAVPSVSAVSFRNFRRLAVHIFFSVLQFALIVLLNIKSIICSYIKLSCHLPIELAIYWTSCNY